MRGTISDLETDELEAFVTQIQEDAMGEDVNSWRKRTWEAERDRDHKVAGLNDKFKKTREEASAKVTELNEKLSYLHGELDQVNARCDCELRKAAKKRKELCVHLEKARGDRDQARFDWKAAEKREKELQEKVNRLNDVLTKVKKDAEDRAWELGTQDQRIKTLERDRDHAEKKAIEIAEEATVLNKANAGFRHKLEVGERKQEILRGRIAEFSCALEEANEDIAARNKELSKAHEGEYILQEKISELESDLEHQEKIIPSLTKQVNTLQEEKTQVEVNLVHAMELLKGL